MPLEIPNLDNRRWADLVEEARALIPRVAPRWTDHNVHDPGMTFIELFAWLAEMQLYQLNRVGRKHREVFTRLAGGDRGLRKPARVRVRVDGDLNSGVFLPAGTQLAPLEGTEIVFETEQDLFLTRSRLIQVIAEDSSGRVDQTQANARPGITFLAFGENADKGAQLTLRFDNFHADEEREIRLTADVFTDDLVARCGKDDPLQVERQETTTTDIDLVWEYLAAGNRWVTLEVVNDETKGFAQSGTITVAVPANTDPSLGFWLRARIRNGYFDIEPRLRSISLNVLPCSQRETVRNESLGTGDGKPDQSFELKKGPVLVPDPEQPSTIVSSDVVDWNLIAAKIEKSDPEFSGNLRRNLATSGGNVFAEFERIKELNKTLKSKPSSEIDDLIGRAPVAVTVAGEQWTLVPSLDSSNPTSKHFLFDVESRRVEFGNGLNGQVPAKGQQVSALWYRASNGRAGNVARGLKWRFRTAAIPGVTLTNPEPGFGGKDPEPLDEMELRTRAMLSRPQRAVTPNDLESLALSTPNAFVARAKALTNCPIPESISVVVVPKIRPGRTGKPKPPSEPFVRKVEQQLQRGRLLCDDIRVIRPIYIEVSVAASLRLLKGAAQETVIERARQALDRFLNGELQPSDKTAAPSRDSVRQTATRSPCPTRWPFGRSVFPSEVYAILEGVTGIDFVSNLTLSASRNDVPVTPDRTGAIPIPLAGLVYAGSHNLTIETNSGRNA